MVKYINYVNELNDCLNKVNQEEISKLVTKLKSCIKSKKAIYIIGNGGSSATASHLASDLAKNTRILPKPKTISLTDNISYITALANDISYDDVFSEQLKNYSIKGDLLIVISGSGNSKNILKALKVAKKRGLFTIGLLGFNGGLAKKYLDLEIRCNSDNYGIIESAHSFIHHYLVESLK